MDQLTHLFSPIKIGSLLIKNRLVMAPMALNYSTEKGKIVQRQIDYYVERARGGVGLIISESNYVSIEGRGAINRMGLHGDEMVPEHRRLVEAIHRENTPIIAQLHHAGRTTSVGAIGQYPVSASATPLLTRGEPFVGVIPRALTVPEIAHLVEMYGEAARRAMEAGFDGILVHAAHGYLLNQFLSPQTNKRTDQYGGSEENRARFLLEIVDRVRKVIGPRVPLVVRLTGEEHVEGGYRAEFICKVARWLEEAGVDEISISAGNYEEMEWMCAPRTFPEGHNVEIASRVKEVVKLPISVAGRIRRPEMADRIIREGKADLIWMGRALMADPHLPRKAQEGRAEEIRECISCNLCITRLLEGLDVQCTVNPESGHERELQLSPAERPRKVVVVGGGPAGLEAARVAALRGHRVTLVEQRDRLGGQLLLAAAPPHSKEMEALARQLAQQVKTAGAQVLVGSTATRQTVDDLRPDVVVVATGARPLVPELPGVELPHVFTAHDLLSGKLDGRLGSRVVVIGGGLTGVAAVEYLLERGHQTTIVEMLEWLMADGNFIEKKTLTRELSERGVAVLARTRAEGITGRGVVVSRFGEKQLLPADSVIMAVGVRSERGLLKQLDLDQVEVHVIGDAVSPRRIQHALEEGALVGRKL